LTVLRELSLVQREAPITEGAPEKSRRGVYSIADNYVRFWFRFVQPYVSFIQAGQGDLAFRELIEPNLHQYLGQLFEKACRQYVQLFWQDKLQIAPKRIGRHWNKFCEIDVLTENLDGSHLVGECKWSQNPIGEEVLEELISDSHHLPTSFQNQMRYVLFSLNGFTEQLKRRAEKEEIYLLGADEMF
jgi:AAA+ ATPase superfamily predicted ATPase